jgi:tRNA pseudouridine55 synthase
MDGLLLINKPKGWTSFDVVAKVRGLIRAETGLKKPKVGHTGTLDPLATGLLVLCVGSYCKRASEFSKLDKTYEVTMKLGETSTTGDEEGTKTAVSAEKPSLEAVSAALEAFVGEIDQVPPQFSAIKVDGQRAYKLAREGKEVKLEPRKVIIYGISGVKYTYPEVSFTCEVSSGTYIRSLVEDIGEKLGTGAYMSNLRRIQVGKFNLSKANSLPIHDVQQHLLEQ